MSDPTWVRTTEVLRRLTVSRATLRALQRASDELGLDRVWIDVGAGRRQDWRWRLSALDEWVAAVGRGRGEQGTRRQRPRQSAATATGTALALIVGELPSGRRRRR